MHTRLLQSLTLLLVGLSLTGPAGGETPDAAVSKAPPDAEAAAPTTEAPPGPAGEAALDPYVITPEQKARLDAQREGTAQEETAAPPKPVEEQQGEAAAETPETATPAADTAAPADQPDPELHPLIESFVDSRYGREHCSAPNHCDNLVELQCLKSGDGPIYYYNNDNGRLLMTCGRACINPDPYDERDCKKCPYTPWVDCQERAWREEQERLRQAREAEIAELQAREAERRTREAEIMQQIEAIEQECNTRIRELQHELDTLE